MGASVEIDMVRDPESNRMDGMGDIIFCDLCTKGRGLVLHERNGSGTTGSSSSIKSALSKWQIRQFKNAKKKKTRNRFKGGENRRWERRRRWRRHIGTVNGLHFVCKNKLSSSPNIYSGAQRMRDCRSKATAGSVGWGQIYEGVFNW